MSFLESSGKNIFYQHFKGKKDINVIYVSGHREVPYEKYKAPKIKDFCGKNGISFTWFDYMGYGKSEGEKATWQLSEWLDNLNSVVEKLPEKKHILVGSSMGGYLMMAQALLTPEKIVGLFGFAPGFGKSFKTLSTTDFIADKDGKIKIDILNQEGFNYIDQNLPIKCPVQLIYSYDDESVDIRSASYMLNNIKQAMIMKVRGISHSMNDDNCVTLANNFISAICK